MPISFASDAVSVVVKGGFDPAIFSPAWLHAQGIIGGQELENATLELITPEARQFNCLWLACTITRDTLDFTTTEVAEFERLRDAAAAVIRLLPQLPVAAMGINRISNFDVGGENNWHRVGDRLTPKSIWDEVLTVPGMKSITLWGVRPDNYGGRIQIAIEPSATVQYGIYVAHNDHYDLTVKPHQPTNRAEYMLEERKPLDATVEKRDMAIEILQPNGWGACLEQKLRWNE